MAHETMLQSKKILFCRIRFHFLPTCLARGGRILSFLPFRSSVTLYRNTTRLSIFSLFKYSITDYIR